MTSGHNSQLLNATLRIGDQGAVLVTSEQELSDVLGVLASLPSGAIVVLARGPKQYIEAVRHGGMWSVTTRHGSYLTRASFTAAMTTDYSAREVAESRAATSIWVRIRRALASYPERELSTVQVQTLFAEYFHGKKFSIPQSGA